MALNKQALNAAALLPVILLVTALYVARDQQFISHKDGDILVVQVRDPLNPSAEAFSDQVMAGAKAAEQDVRRERTTPHVRGLIQGVRQADQSTGEITRSLARDVSVGPIIGIISGGTSLTDAPLVELAQHLQIPLLLGVATNDDLTGVRRVTKASSPASPDVHYAAENGGATQYVFRLPPNNSAQAESLTKAALKELSRLSKGLTEHKNRCTLIVIHEDNAYGNFLDDKIADDIEEAKLNNAWDPHFDKLTFTIDTGTTIHSLLPTLEKFSAHIDAAVIIFLGYSQHAIDLLEGLNAYNITQLPVFLSDGCFSLKPDLRGFVGRLRKVQLSFPSNPYRKGDASGDMSVTGFFGYGYAGYLLLAGIDEARGRLGTASLMEVLNAVKMPTTGNIAARLKQMDVEATQTTSTSPSYQFAATGEPQGVSFLMNPVEPPSKNPVEPPLKNPVEPPLKNPVEPLSKNPVEPLSKNPVEPLSKNPVEPLSK